MKMLNSRYYIFFIKYFGLPKNSSYSNVHEAALNLLKNKKTVDVNKLLDMLEACNHSYMLMRAKKYNAHALILPSGKIVEMTT